MPAALLLSGFLAATSALAAQTSQALTPRFQDRDASRPAISVRLTLAASGFSQPTDFAVLPTDQDRLVVLEKSGAMKVHSLGRGKTETILKLGVRTASEMGLLGIAFHPEFAKNRKIYVNWNPADGTRRTRISEWSLTETGPQLKAHGERVLLEVEQPYSNHKGGQLLFGPDGMLYIGLGDGGSGGDPKGNAQNLKSLLGKMLRIDVNKSTAPKNYAIPADNPFINKPAALPEIWAYGLRNPWRFTFVPSAAPTLLIADVGQDKWEEITLVKKGENHGWNFREGRHCYEPETNCPAAGLTDPIYEYGRTEGQSVIGGLVYEGKAIPELRGKYLFADFLSGRIWALEPGGRNGPDGLRPVSALGKWEIMPVTFARRTDGELWVADFTTGNIYLIEKGPARPAS